MPRVVLSVTITDTKQVAATRDNDNDIDDDDDDKDNDNDKHQIDDSMEQPPKKKTRTLDSAYTKQQKERWEVMFQLLLEYKKKNESTLVPQIYDEIPELGNWVCNQRVTFTNEELSVDRVQRLNSIDFVWRVTKIRVPWIDMYQRLVAYKEQFGTTAVPQKYNEDPVLGKWVNTQRCRCKLKDRINLLKDIGFDWNPKRGGRRS